MSKHDAEGWLDYEKLVARFVSAFKKLPAAEQVKVIETVDAMAEALEAESLKCARHSADVTLYGHSAMGPDGTKELKR